MFYDLLYTLKEMVSMLNLAAITCPAGLIIALHYMSERKQKVHRIDYDPVMRRKYELEAQSSTGFASFMTLVGLSVAFLSMAYLGWPSETRQQSQAAWQFLQTITGKS
ncbi:hypothetical protein [Aquidulcibacter paucihalophilus]|uniref:hypothetical protein n=1 Tax=Aquidulcibacter paucihalophilus TaxID=1978549 RepID=UPI000A195C6B|nr:hypothetical protein [Aquidulcibacter paucihalophilus]